MSNILKIYMNTNCGNNKMTRNLRIYMAALVSMLCFTLRAQVKPAAGGYPIANFALTVNVSEQGDMYGQVLQNVGKLGGWLLDCGPVRVELEKDGKKEMLSQFKDKDIRRVFPFVEVEYAKSSHISSNIKLKTFCPLAVNDAETSSLPVLMLEMECTNPTRKEETFTIVVKPGNEICGQMSSDNDGKRNVASNGSFAVAADVDAEWSGNAFRVPVTLKGKEMKAVRIAISLYDSDWISARSFASAGEVVEHACSVWDILETKTEEFSQAIPETGIEDVDTYLRWYMVPAISLTRYNKKGEILTMGYMELNPRDSYWTTWVHLLLYKDAERKMIEECLAAVSPAGKMPTTILPVIEREDDLDINAFLILRAARFYQLYHEKDKLLSYWPVLKKAMDWLISRDTKGKGLPRQVSFWGDWKDVKGVEDREYSPFSALVYLAALKKMMYMGEECGDSVAIEKYEEAYRKGYDIVNKPVEEGGMWNGRYYCQLWKNGSVNDKLLEDQTIGILFDVVPRDKALKIIESLNEMSLTPYGVAETFPYYPKEFGLDPATYHNGAVWPWVNFMDCWARIRLGQKDDAIDIIKRVGRADIIASGDWSANEHINSLTGENLGFHIQGWSAALFGTVYFGLVNPDIVP